MNSSIAPADENPYRAPEAAVADMEQASAQQQLFYVVAKPKFLALFIGTMGIYVIYWFYKNWALLNRKHRAYWPVARGIFSIFFAHSLFGEIDKTLRRKQTTRTFSWSPGTLATGYVIFSILMNLCDRLSMKNIGSPITDLLGFVLLIPIVLILLRAQQAINLAEGDPEGKRNSRITLANVAWLIVGAVLWILVLLGLYLTLKGDNSP
jgi:hypothetical protein